MTNRVRAQRVCNPFGKNGIKPRRRTPSKQSQPAPAPVVISMKPVAPAVPVVISEQPVALATREIVCSACYLVTAPNGNVCTNCGEALPPKN